MNPISNLHAETVLVEESDDRLVAVEEAKRTGEPFVSVGANRTVAVPHAIAEQIAEEKSQEDVYVGRFGATYAGHLKDYHEAIKDPNFVTESNEEKARAHEEYSAELVRKQMEDEKGLQEKMAEGFEPSLAVQQANLERAREHEDKSVEYAKVRAERVKEEKPVLAVIDEMVEVIRAEDLANKPLNERAEAFSGIVEKPESLEKGMTDALKIKDDIIATKESFEDHAADHETLRDKDRPGLEVMERFGSPEELREGTALAQAAADNQTEEAAKAITEVTEEVAQHDSEEVQAEPGKVLREAEEAVEGGRPVADEMPETPKE